MLYWSLHCSPASARYLWNASFSVTWHQFWVGMLKMLLTNSRISYIGLFWILRQRGFVALGENKELRVLLPSTIIQISFLFLFSTSWLCLWALISRALMENCPTKHNLYCSSFFFSFPSKNHFWGRFWGFFSGSFWVSVFKSSRNPSFPQILSLKENPSLPYREVGNRTINFCCLPSFL